MFTQSEYVAIRLNREAYDRLSKEAQNVRMLRQAGLLPASKIQRVFCYGAGWVGRAMVAVGQRLVRVGATPARTNPAVGD